MELTDTQYDRMAPVLRGNVRISHWHVLDVILDVAAHGGTGRGVPARSRQ